MPEIPQYWPLDLRDSSGYAFPHDTVAGKILLNDTSSQSAIPGYDRKFFTEKDIGNEIVPEKKYTHENGWMFYLLLAGFVLLAFVRVFHNRRLRMVFQGVYARHFASQLSREGNIFNERISVFLFIIYVISTSLFIYMILVRFPGIFSFTPRPVMILPIASFLIVYWFAKVLFIKLTSVIFTTQQRSGEYLLTIFLINMVNGVVLLILLVPAIYIDGKIFLVTGMAYLALTFLFKLMKGMVIGLSFIKFSRLHLFLYLCTLEILPLILITKFIYINLVG